MNRRQFALGAYGLGAIATLAMFIGFALVGPPTLGGGYLLTPARFGVLAATQFAPLPLVASMLVRRVHDHGRSGWLVIGWLGVACVISLLAELLAIRDTPFETILMLPIVLSFFWLILAPGDPKANAHGQPPAEGWWP